MRHIHSVVWTLSMFPPLLTHSPTHPLTHSPLTHSPTYPLTHPPDRCCVQDTCEHLRQSITTGQPVAVHQVTWRSNGPAVCCGAYRTTGRPLSCCSNIRKSQAHYQKQIYPYSYTISYNIIILFLCFFLFLFLLLSFSLSFSSFS